MRKRAGESEPAPARGKRPDPPAVRADASAAAVLALQRRAGNQNVARALAARRAPTALVQRMQTAVPVVEGEADEEQADEVEQQTPPPSLSPHDQKIADDLSKLSAPADDKADLDPHAANEALAKLGLHAPATKPDEIADMEETLKTAVELGIDDESLQGYRKQLHELKVKRVLSNKQASPEELSSTLREAEANGVNKAVLDPLRLQVLTLGLHKRCATLHSEVAPLQKDAQQWASLIEPLNVNVNQLMSIVMLHPTQQLATVAGCRKQAVGLQTQLNTARQEFAAVLEVFKETLALACGPLPTTLPALRKRDSLIEARESGLDQCKLTFQTAKTTHTQALNANDAVKALSTDVASCFRSLCEPYLSQEPCLQAYNAQYANEFSNYAGQVTQLKVLDAQPVTVGGAKQIVKLVTDMDFTAEHDEYLNKFRTLCTGGAVVKTVMDGMLAFKETKFSTLPSRGKINLRDLLQLGHVRLKHKGTYRDTKEKGAKKGNQHGPFSRSFWVTITSVGIDCDWVIHVHFGSDEPTLIGTAGNIQKMHAKSKDAEPFKGGALADWTGIVPLQNLVLGTALNAQKDKFAGIELS